MTNNSNENKGDNSRSNAPANNEHYDAPERMVENLRPDQTNVTNTVFLEQRALNTQPAQYGNLMHIPRTIENEMADKPWMASDQLKKPILIGQDIWSSTDARGKVIASFDFPEVLTKKDSIVSRTLSMYAYFRFTPVFRFQVNATQFHQGQLIASFDPFSQALEPADIPIGDESKVYFDAPIFNEVYATGLPNVKIMASESDPVELEIPFVHPRNYFTTNSAEGFDILGKIRIAVLNNLKFAEGTSPTLTITTWLYAREASVHVPIYYHDLSIPKLRTTSLVESVEGLISGGTNLIGNIMTGQVGKALRTGQGVVDNLGKVFGFDYPVKPVHPDKTISPVETLAHGVGVSRAQRLALDPTSTHPTNTIEGSTNDDPMDILKIARTPMLLTTINWTSMDPLGSKIYSKELNPTQFFTTYNYDDRDINYRTFVGFVTEQFAFWKGGFTIDVEFVATRFQSGKILVAFVPNEFVGTPTYEQVSTSCPNIIIDLQQTSSVSFSVPYVSATPIKSTSFTNKDESLLGYVYFFVQNPLVSASNVANNVDINLYIRASEDYALYVPKKDVNDDNFSVSNKLRVTSGEIGILTNIKTEPETSANMAFGNNDTITRPRFGENYSMLDIIRRYDMATNLAVTVADKDNPVLYVRANIIRVHPTHYNTAQERYTQELPKTLLRRWTSLFSAWSGSIRYKFITSEPRTSQDYLTVIHCVRDVLGSRAGAGFEEQATGLASIRTNLAQDNALEIEVPYYVPYNLLLTRDVSFNFDSDDLNPVDNGSLSIIVGTSGATKVDDKPRIIRMQMYMAAGEDFRLYYLRPPPGVFRPVTRTSTYYRDYDPRVQNVIFQ